MQSLNRFMFWKKTPIIEFICRPEYYKIVSEPKPAGTMIPEWFKKLDLRHDRMQDQFGVDAGTAKLCKPLIDAFNYGFVMTLASDVRIRSNHDCTEIDSKSPVAQLPIVEFHEVEQVGGNNSVTKNQGRPIKFINYWCIKTAPGWSTLFIPPINNFNLPFTCISGIVDTDKYFKEINFPAIWNEPNFDDILKAGTPLVTAIPIKRQTFKQKMYSRSMSLEEMMSYDVESKLLQSRFSYYTNYVREKK